MKDPWGFTRAQVMAAAKWWNLTEEEVDGEPCWRMPDCITAIWWRRKIVAPPTVSKRRAG